MKPDKGLILNLFETNGKNDILNILIPSWSLLEPLGAQSLPLDSAAPGTRTPRAWTASQRNVKIGYATGVLAIAPNQQDVLGCTGMYWEACKLQRLSDLFTRYSGLFRYDFSSENADVCAWPLQESSEGSLQL